MANIRNVYHRDLRAIIKYRAAFITITVLCLLPSLYTLVNVRAIWNPYKPSAVDNISVAVVNKDSGTYLRGKQVNLGSQVVSNLRKNKQIGWKFTSKSHAAQGLRNGTYYAEIEIPTDFSQNLTSIVTDTPQKAHLVYKMNTKNSPMGAKITAMAAKTLVTKIREKFIYEVNRTIFSYLNIVGRKASEHQSQILSLKDLIIMLGDNLSLTSNSLGAISDTSNMLAVAFTEFKPVINASQNVNLNDQSNTSGTGISSLVKKSLNRSFSNLGHHLASLTASTKQLWGLTDQLNHTVGSTSLSDLDAKVSNLSLQVDLLDGQIRPLIELLQSVRKINHSRQISDLITSLTSVSQLAEAQKKQLNALKKVIAQNGKLDMMGKQQINHRFSEMILKLNHSLAQYNHSVKAQLSDIGYNLMSAVGSSRDVLGSLKKVKQLNNQSLDTIIQGNRLVANTSGNLENQLASYKNDIRTMSNRLKLTSDSNIANIVTVLQSNPDLMGSALAQPFTVKSEDIYKVNSFGAAFASTYIALSIWVGCTMLVAVLHTKAPKLAQFRGLSVREEYLGKLLTFGTLSLIQTLVILLSSMCLLHIHVASFFLLLMVGLMSSVTFTIIVYTMAALFGNLGKALIVMLMAVQLAGSGAMYPMQLNPLLFRIFQPLFPFAYSVGGFREAIGGANMGTVVVDFFVLMCMSLLGLAVGLSTKKPLKKYTDRLLNDFKKTGMG